MTRPRLEEFRFDAGALCLDFVATLGRRGDPEHRRVERIPTPDRFGEWLRECGLTGADASLTRGDLVSAVVLREAIDGLVRGVLGGGDVTADARTVNQWAECPVATPRFDPRTATVTRHSPEPVAAALAEIARDAVVTAGRAASLPVRVCGMDDCRMLFIDQSRGRPRRWCSASRCGNRAKVAAYRQRNTI
ncbi:CGNR zinc finger domain-containing protein [Actinomadura rugatobispora]|uniref:CGNR zinc finger domain-containing protein n=1 Tax=Actinomadura rugatobispora TaxID=1994 RepID=A0ABW0ZS73_9ACTN|nr:CGNR zinc finger domain-containing protein [Actinomadura rugatobispora]